MVDMDKTEARILKKDLQEGIRQLDSLLGEGDHAPKEEVEPDLDATIKELNEKKDAQEKP